MQLAPRLAFSLILRPVRPYTALFLVAMLGLGAAFILKRASEWDVCFYPTAQELLTGGDIYTPSHGYVYPPLQSLLAVPVAPLPLIAQRVIWFLVNAISLWIAIRSAWRLAGGPDLERSNAPRREHLAFALGLVVGMTYFLNSLMHHQTDVLLAALLFAGCERIPKGRGLAAATLLGLAAAMKCTPLLFALYLLARGRFLAAAWLVAVAIGASLLPDLIHSPADTSTWLVKWFNTFLAPMASAEHRPGVWASDIIFNQSIIGAVNRWSMTTWSLDGRFHTSVIEPLLNPRSMKAIVLAAALSLGGLSLALLIRSRDLACECAIVLCGMLLFSPMSSPAHFGLLMLPAFLLARSRSVFAHSCAAVLLVLALAGNRDLIGVANYSIGLWYGSITAATLAALLGTWRVFATRRAVQ